MSRTEERRVFVVTGAGRGIGRAVAIYLAQQGGGVALVDMDEAALEETRADIVAAGDEARAYHCDITQEAAVEDVFARIRADFGRVDGLINNAGIMRDGLLVKVKDGKVVRKMGADQFDMVIDVCLKGAFLCGREAAVHMIESKVTDGVIVNVASVSYAGNYGQSNYSAAKAGLVAMTKVWSKELGRYGIRTVAIAPGPIETDMLRQMPPEALEALAGQIPLRRIGSVDNISKLIGQLIENDFINGAVVGIDGGVTV